MPDKTPENKETLTKNEDGYSLNGLPPVMVGAAPKKTGNNLHREDRHFLYCGIKAMELSDSDRPVSFSSTSSSASSRDSHCSCGSRTTLVSNSHLGLFNQDKEVGAIKLELHPTQQFPSKELRKNNPIKEQLSDGNIGRKPNMPRKPETKENNKNCVMSLIVESTSPKLLYVDRVVQEILETERTYVQDLRSIVKDYLDCITDQSKLSLGTEERSALFGNIKDIYHFNSELLQDLENCENDPVAIAECFVSKSEDFHIYTQYCTNYPRSVAVLTECMRNKSLAKFFRERQEALQHSLPLGSYLLKPVQRILKYHLLLHEIENHLDKDTEGYDVVLDAIDTMQRVAWHINDMKRKHEHAIRLQEIQSLLTNWKGPDLASYGELVLEGTFRIQRAKNERTLFLFDKLLLITKKRDETFTYKAHILCGNLMLVEVIPKEPLSFSVFHYKNPKMQHTVQAKSQQDKRLWILHLKRLILENHPAKIPAKAKQAILEMDAIYHPGFHYSPEEMKASSNSKEGITPQRMRRKSEPSSRVHKITKSSEMDPNLQKRMSTEGTLLSQTELFFSPRKNHSLNCQRLDSNEAAYSSGQEDNILTYVTEQTDADDEEETEQSTQHFQQKPKGGRKRLNSQVTENFEKRRTFNLNICEIQNSKKRTDEAPSQMNTKLSFSCNEDSQLSEQFTPQNNSFVANILGRTAAVRNIWTDHQIRQALFPSRQPLQDNIDDDDDDYQMFMPSDSTSNLTSIACEERTPSNRPCSWHLGLVHKNDISNLNSHRIMRRASSAGESKTGARYRKNYHDQSASWNEIKNSRSDMDNLQECQESSEELTIDDIDHVYDNISFEDLKLMGLAQREESNRTPQGSAKDSLYETYDEDYSFKKTQASQNRTCIPSRNEAIPRRQPSPVRSYELRISEENIYDTIRLPEESVSNFKSDPLKCSKKRSFLGMETDFTCCNQFRQFVSEESLQFSEDENPYHYVPLDRGCLNLAESSSNSDSHSHKSVADKLSEEVDEIWNDLENYIKKNEEKSRDHVLAAFPVCKDEVDNQASSRTTGGPNKDVKYSLTMFPLPEKGVLSKTLPNKVARLSEANIKFEEATSYKANSLIDLNRSSLSNDRCFADSLYKSPNNIFCTVNTINTNGELDSVDKTKNRVFMMARQYSQKIKKANQFLKVKSAEQEQFLNRQQKSKHKDLAAILEEKKQGGPAIGARIAEYSQLYDQIVFRETSPKTQKITSQETNIRYSSPVSTSHLAAECLKAENWLLHSTYSNGELSDFSPWPETPHLKTKSSLIEMGGTPNVRPVTGSVPSFQTPLRPHIPAQRWSTIINQPNKENLYHSHLYNSLGRTESSTRLPPSSRSQSSCSIVLNKSEESINYPPEMKKKHLHSNKKCLTDHCQESVSVAIPGHSTCDETKQASENVSDVILQDSQKILRVKRNLPSNAQIATHNYFSNFKDTDNGEGDDDDYVEIKSEDEGSDLETFCNQTKDLDPKVNPHPTHLETPSGKLLDPSKLSDPFLTACNDSDKLNDYLWSVPSSNQPNIVQSLREKFQCLSSSSFA
ncbi:PREDICTED: pleckstrin homology domain-containing family G member 1 isoform X1 [Thamnophis sirtalis]|uniref:Pleckstrin homology domain-containing family G member 1 isoform X1 n=2 Tax=Thamnophis sirtalis TaxID=35019 RepID=A0A6I9XN14_9SAUR|nr:PREDICTED: pleckstrin homology domain-containing family G member 1 isoform X1 [Thamnophis sirtalis]